MNISKYCSMLVVGLVVIGFTSVSMASEESKHSEAKVATNSEVMAEGEDVAKEESIVGTNEEIEYGAKIELGSEEGEAKAEQKANPQK
ncbi:MAG: hypothetical protein GY775_01905 [Candidatus Scalindua sp.]|nr:hypothetical protein [Candidatus Scalindua sp.]